MATDDLTVVHPGDVLQDSDGLFLLASETHSWGVGAVMRWRAGGPPNEIRESYHRLKAGQFVVVGRAHLIPEEVAQRRRDSIATARALAREQGPPKLSDTANPFQWALNAAAHAQAWGLDVVTAIAEAQGAFAHHYPGVAVEFGQPAEDQS